MVVGMCFKKTLTDYSLEIWVGLTAAKKYKRKEDVGTEKASGRDCDGTLATN